MSTVRRRLGFALVVALGLAPAQAQAGGFAEAWKISTTSVWPPAVIDGKVVLKNGDSLEAHSLKDGRQLWQTKPGSLRYGTGVLAAGRRYVYVLGGRELYVVNPADGKVVKKKALRRPSYVYSTGDSVYVVTRAGVSRLSEDGSKLVSRAKGYTGEILGADGNYVVLYSQDGGTKRLVVADLKGGKKSYEFKLLPDGWHRVVKVGGSRLVFLDYSQRQRDGSNPRKLYFTEADYVRSKKVKDQALHKRYPVTYASAACDHFWAATDDSGIVFIGNYGPPTQQSNLLAYDPGQDKLLWNRSGSVVSMGLLLHGGRLWSGVADEEGNAYAVAYSPDDGSLLEKLPLDAPGTGAPVAAGRRILVRSRNAIYCFAPGAGKPLVLKGGAMPPKKDWRMYRDRTAGYLIRTPRTWEFQREKLVKMGGLRMSIPFVRKETVGGKTTFLGSVHILTWEAAGRDINSLWNSVYTQRRQLNPDVRVVKVYKVPNVGGTGLTGIKAQYTFRSKGGYPVQMRSLCVVSHGVAFELRGWAGPQRPAEIWREIEGIFSTFQPRKFR